MSAEQAKEMILLAFTIAGIFGFLRLQRQGELDLLGRLLVGVMVGSVMLGFAADFAPEVAGGFAALMLVATLTSVGPEVVDLARATRVKTSRTMEREV